MAKSTEFTNGPTLRSLWRRGGSLPSRLSNPQRGLVSRCAGLLLAGNLLCDFFSIFGVYCVYFRLLLWKIWNTNLDFGWECFLYTGHDRCLRRTWRAILQLYQVASLGICSCGVGAWWFPLAPMYHRDKRSGGWVCGCVVMASIRFSYGPIPEVIFLGTDMLGNVGEHCLMGPSNASTCPPRCHPSFPGTTAPAGDRFCSPT